VGDGEISRIWLVKYNAYGLYWCQIISLDIFLSLQPKMGGLALVKDGNEVLANLGLENASYSDLMNNLALLAGVYLTVSWLGLTFGGPKFMDATPK
jgi:hypothetical protein